MGGMVGSAGVEAFVMGGWWWLYKVRRVCWVMDDG